VHMHACLPACLACVQAPKQAVLGSMLNVT